MQAATAFTNSWLCYDQILGEGSFGEVKLLFNKHTGKKIACKIIEHKNNDVKTKVEKEVMIHKMLNHVNVIRYYGRRHGPEKEYIFLEYVSGGELFDKIEPGVGMPSIQAQYFMRHLLYGMQYLHQRGVVHRDIKPENLLIDSQGILKICDFGLATVFRKNGKERKLKKPCGTKPYKAPEVGGGMYYFARPADLWSCGIVLVAMLAGQLPWNEASRTDEDFSLWCSPKYLSVRPWSKLGNTVLSLTRQMLNPDSEKRITLKQIFRHPWMKFDCQNNNYSTTGISNYTNNPMKFMEAETRYNRETPHITLSQPAMVRRPSCVNELLNDIAANQMEDLAGYSEPTKADDFILQLASLPVKMENFHNLVKRTTRFYVVRNREDSLEYLGSVLDGLRYSWTLDSTGTVTISTVDYCKNPLVFKLNLLEIDGKILMDFRLSKGCGLDFKRKIIKLKRCLSSIIEKSRASTSSSISSSSSSSSDN